MNNLFVFPFDRIAKNSKIVIYGAGVVGYDYYLQVKAIDYCDVLFVADPYYKTVDQFNSIGLKVTDPAEIKNSGCDFVVVATRFAELEREFLSALDKMGIPGEKIISECGRTLENKQKGLQYARIMYAQRAEDWLVMSLFKFIGVNTPSYIDIGAHHPYELSNTALLHENGGKGINIEPNPSLITNFYEERPGDVNLNVGISGKSDGGILPFYVLADEFGAEAPALNTFSQEAANEMIRTGKSGRKLHILKTLEIQVIKLETVINEHADGKWPDYMSIDIEGEEYEVIDGSDLTEGPIVITVEVDKQDTRKFCSLMSAKGYSVYCRTGGNITYVRNDFAEKAIYG